MRDALKYSLNIPVTKAQQLIGTENVVAMAQRLGLQFDPRHNGEFAVPSLTLGTLGIHQIDLAGAYGAIANQGRLMEPYLIERIEDSDGNVIYDHATDAGDGSRFSPPPRPTSSPTSWPTTPTQPPTRCGARASSSRPMTAGGVRPR